MAYRVHTERYIYSRTCFCLHCYSFLSMSKWRGSDLLHTVCLVDWAGNVNATVVFNPPAGAQQRVLSRLSLMLGIGDIEFGSFEATREYIHACTTYILTATAWCTYVPNSQEHTTEAHTRKIDHEVLLFTPTKTTRTVSTLSVLLLVKLR